MVMSHTWGDLTCSCDGRMHREDWGEWAVSLETVMLCALSFLNP